MRVLVIHTVYKYKGGEDSVVANESALLKSIGADVELLQFSNSGNTVLKLLQLPFNYSAYRKTKQKIKTFKPDIVHIHNLHLAASASPIYAIKKADIPFVVTLHNYRILCPSATLFKDGKMFTDAVNKAFSWKAVFNKVYQNSALITFWLSLSMLIHKKLKTWENANKFIVLGQHTKDIIAASKYKNIIPKILIKPNFCYTQSTGNDSPRDYYLYIGRLSEEKGINVLLSAFAKNGLKLKIAGSGVLEDKVKEWSSKHANINFLGVVSQQDAFDLLAHAKALIFPSIWYEPFGMVIIEAFSVSTPVIASDLGQLKKTITHQFNGLRFEAGNPVDLENKVQFFEDLTSEQLTAYQNNAYESYEANYSPQKNSAQLLDIYNLALKEA